MFARSAAILSFPVYVGAVIAVVVAWRGGATACSWRWPPWPTILMVAVALMTEGGFAGNLRYVALPAAFVCVLAGAGWVEVVRGVSRRWGAPPPRRSR